MKTQTEHTPWCQLDNSNVGNFKQASQMRLLHIYIYSYLFKFTVYVNIVCLSRMPLAYDEDLTPTKSQERGQVL